MVVFRLVFVSECVSVCNVAVCALVVVRTEVGVVTVLDVLELIADAVFVSRVLNVGGVANVLLLLLKDVVIVAVCLVVVVVCVVVRVELIVGNVEVVLEGLVNAVILGDVYVTGV